jgi:hypothetical protein
MYMTEGVKRLPQEIDVFQGLVLGPSSVTKNKDQGLRRVGRTAATMCNEWALPDRIKGTGSDADQTGATACLIEMCNY